MPKAAIYCRLSEEDRGKADPTADSESIRNQKALLCRYAQERDWEIYQIYSDEDYAGADRRRPAFNCSGMRRTGPFKSSSARPNPGSPGR